MGKIVNNKITSSLSGSFGEDLIFRQVGTQTFFVKKPVYKKRSPTPAQHSNRNTFAEAQNYASVALQDPELSEWYNIVAKVNGFKNAHRAAANDYLTKPEIEEVDATGYSGNVGDVIHVKPRASLKITRLEVSIYNAESSVIESGLAVKNGFEFRYLSRVLNTSLDRARIVFVAYDRLGKSCKFVEHLYE